MSPLCPIGGDAGLEMTIEPLSPPPVPVVGRSRSPAHRCSQSRRTVAGADLDLAADVSRRRPAAADEELAADTDRLDRAVPFSVAVEPSVFDASSHVRFALPVRFVPSETAIWPSSAPFVMPEPVSGTRSAVAGRRLDRDLVTLEPQLARRRGARDRVRREGVVELGRLVDRELDHPAARQAVAVGQDRARAVDRDAHQATVQPRSA
jgi:hypothetical protein